MSESKILIKTTGQDGANVTFTTSQFTAISWSIVGLQGGNDVSASVYGYVNASTLVELCRIVGTTDGYDVIDLGDSAAQYTTLVVKLNRPMRSGTLYVTAERESISASQFWHRTPRRYIGEWGSLRADGANGTSARFISGTNIFAAMSDGVRWRPVGAFATLQPNASVTGTTSETTLASITIPGGLLGADGTVRAYALFSFVGTAGTKAIRTKFGGSNFTSLSATAATLSASVSKSLCNLSVASQQSIAAGTLSDGSSQTVGVVTLAVDSSVDQQLAITVQLSNTADSATLVKVIVEVL